MKTEEKINYKNEICPKCEKGLLVKYGKIKQKNNIVFKYQCRQCKKVLNENTIFLYNKMNSLKKNNENKEN